jgi:hypothetical protein
MDKSRTRRAKRFIRDYNCAMPPVAVPGTLTLADVRAAAARIEGRIQRTPVLRRAVGAAELLCKAEARTAFLSNTS